MPDQKNTLPSVQQSSLSKQGGSNLRKVLDDRMTLSEAIEAAGSILKAYPPRDTGDGYIGALAATLGSYPRSIALKCAQVPGGIASECKFYPTVADLVAWCEKRTEVLRQWHERDLRIQQQLDDRQQFEGIQVARSKRLSLFELKEKYGDWHDNWRQPGLKALEAAEAARAMLIAELGENGADIFDALPDAAE